MNAQDAMTLLAKLECQQIRTDSRNAWVTSTCPLARWTHKGGVDHHPSFGISIHPDGESKFNCFTCGLDGNLRSLLWRIGSESKKDLSQLSDWVSARNAPSLSALQQKSQSITVGWKKAVDSSSGLSLPTRTASKLGEAPPPLAETELDRFAAPSAEILTYLRTDRRLTDESIKKWELRWHEGARRIAIPIRSIEGKLVGISGRAFDGQRPKFLHNTGFRKDFYLYGERFCRKGEPGYLTEGFFDVMYLQQQGINAFAVMGSSLSSVQVEKCLSLFSKVIIVPDGDEPGLEAADRIRQQLSARTRVLVSPMAQGKDPDDLDDAELDALRVLGQ